MTESPGCSSPGRRLSPLLLTALLVSAGALAGCYHGSARSVSPDQLTRERGWLLVQGVDLVKQRSDNECGAAALAMMLHRWSVPASTDDIVQGIPAAKGEPIAAGVLRDFARHKGLQAFIIKGEMADLVKEVTANRPVMVGLVQRYSDKARAHYEVVTGINPTAKRVLLLDPGRGLREDGFDGFMSEWEPAGRMTLVIVPS